MCRTRLSERGCPLDDVDKHDLIDARVFIVCALQRPAFQQLLGEASPEESCATCDQNFHACAVLDKALHPAEPFFGTSSRSILAADPSFVTHLVK